MSAQELEIIEKSKTEPAKVYHDIAGNLWASSEVDDFPEIALNRWIQQLKELKLEITLPSSVKFCYSREIFQDNSTCKY